MVLGNGVRLSGALKELDKFLHKTNIPVITSVNGNDIINGDYKYESKEELDKMFKDYDPK